MLVFRLAEVRVRCRSQPGFQNSGWKFGECKQPLERSDASELNTLANQTQAG